MKETLLIIGIGFAIIIRLIERLQGTQKEQIFGTLISIIFVVTIYSLVIVYKIEILKVEKLISFPSLETVAFAISWITINYHMILSHKRKDKLVIELIETWEKAIPYGMIPIGIMLLMHPEIIKIFPIINYILITPPLILLYFMGKKIISIKRRQS